MSALFFELSAGLDEIQSISYRKRSTVMTAPYKKQSEVEWESHFMTDNGKIKWIYTREKDDSPITVMQVRPRPSGPTGSDIRARGQRHDVH
jgi:hypothetical protein